MQKYNPNALESVGKLAALLATQSTEACTALVSAIDALRIGYQIGYQDGIRQEIVQEAS